MSKAFNFLAKPFKWIWKECKDWKTFIIFLIVALILSSEVWVCYLLGFILGNEWLIGIASACWIWWLLPASPFLPLCIGITLVIKKIFKIGGVKNENKRCEKRSERELN